jgi:hypothetical protein
MCSECYSSPCDARCPNAPEPASFCTCDKCKDEILVGEDYYGGPDCDFTLCQYCADLISGAEALKFAGYSVNTADPGEPPEPDWDLIRKERMMGAYA